MQVGDKVQLTGTVKDVVSAKDNPSVRSILIAVDPDGKEYWAQEANVSAQSALTPAEEAEAAKEHTGGAPHAPAKTTTTSHK